MKGKILSFFGRLQRIFASKEHMAAARAATPYGYRLQAERGYHWDIAPNYLRWEYLWDFMKEKEKENGDNITDEQRKRAVDGYIKKHFGSELENIEKIAEELAEMYLAVLKDSIHKDVHGFRIDFEEKKVETDAYLDRRVHYEESLEDNEFLSRMSTSSDKSVIFISYNYKDMEMLAYEISEYNAGLMHELTTVKNYIKEVLYYYFNLESIGEEKPKDDIFTYTSDGQGYEIKKG